MEVTRGAILEWVKHNDPKQLDAAENDMKEILHIVSKVSAGASLWWASRPLYGISRKGVAYKLAKAYLMAHNVDLGHKPRI